MLERLVSVAPRGSEASRFGQLHLAELIVRTQPFRAASLARAVASECASDRAYGLVGLAMTVMGHYRAAVKAFHSAIQLAPGHAGHLHNLGHVLDVGLGHARSAVRYLELAHGNEPDVREIASSLAHAVARSGQRARAVEILHRRVGMSPTLASSTIDEWLARMPGL
jgi:Tfp pilus assembly protein PilF